MTEVRRVPSFEFPLHKEAMCFVQLILAKWCWGRCSKCEWITYRRTDWWWAKGLHRVHFNQRFRWAKIVCKYSMLCIHQWGFYNVHDGTGDNIPGFCVGYTLVHTGSYGRTPAHYPPGTPHWLVHWPSPQQRTSAWSRLVLQSTSKKPTKVNHMLSDNFLI